MKKKILIGSIASIFIVSCTLLAFYHYKSLNNRLNEVKSQKRNIQNQLHETKKKKQKSLKDLKKSKNKVNDLNERVDDLKSKNDNLNEQNEALKHKNKTLKEQSSVHVKKQPKPMDYQVDDSNGWQSFYMTYYDADFQSTGKRPGDKNYGITASGRHVKQGVTIAVDPDVIPLGSWVLIKFPDGHIDKRRADDTGRLINGKHIDLYVPHASVSMANKHVKLKIIN